MYSSNWWFFNVIVWGLAAVFWFWFSYIAYAPVAMWLSLACGVFTALCLYILNDCEKHGE